MENEIWKDVLDYEGLYQVSNLGRIKSLGRNVIMPTGGIRVQKEKIRKPYKSTRGYFVSSLCKNGKTKLCSLHRLVWEAFNGKTNLQIDHIIEGNKLDNRLSNLQALTSRENTVKYRTTLQSTSKYTGVHWCKRERKWISSIRVKQKLKQLGAFRNEIDAHNAYQTALNNVRTS